MHAAARADLVQRSDTTQRDRTPSFKPLEVEYMCQVESTPLRAVASSMRLQRSRDATSRSSIAVCCSGEAQQTSSAASRKQRHCRITKTAPHRLDTTEETTRCELLGTATAHPLNLRRQAPGAAAATQSGMGRPPPSEAARASVAASRNPTTMSPLAP